MSKHRIVKKIKYRKMRKYFTGALSLYQRRVLELQMPEIRHDMSRRYSRNSMLIFHAPFKKSHAQQFTYLGRNLIKGVFFDLSILDPIDHPLKSHV